MLTTVPLAAAAADDPVERALSLVSQKKYSEARAVLRREPDAPRVRLMNGIILTREGKIHEAAAIFERLLGERPKMFEPYNNLAVLYAEQGRLDEARAALLEALQRRPDPVAYANLGDVYTRLADRAYSRARDGHGGVSAKPVERRVSMPSGSGKRRPDMPVPAEPPAKPTAASAPNDAPLALGVYPGQLSAAGSSSPAEDNAPHGGCVQAGRFKERKTVAVAMEWIHSQGAEAVDLRQKRNLVVNSYRVYLPVLPSANAASAKLRELRRQGFRDVAVIRKGGRANRISLGVYKSKSNAERRIAELAQLGYSAKLAAIEKTSNEYAVRARAGGAPSALASAWKLRFPGQPIEFVDCP